MPPGIIQLLVTASNAVRAASAAIRKEENISDKWFRMHKAYKEATTHAPLPLKNHYDGLNMTGTWQKY